MTSYTPIQCDLYDYIEIACLRHYMLDIKLLDDENIRGKALTTQITNKQEFLVIEIGNEQQQIRLDKIKSITVLDKGAEYRTVKIN